MTVETIPDSSATFRLLCFDKEGKERVELGGFASGIIFSEIQNDPPTDVFLFCHGWLGDIPSAKMQYKKWIGAFLTSADMGRASEVFGSFKPILIGLHWPSEPWGNEEIEDTASFSGGCVAGRDNLFDEYLERLGDNPAVRRPLEIIINEARRSIAPESLSEKICHAYLDLNDALGLASGPLSAPPDADRGEFDPQELFEVANEGSSSFGGAIDFGGLLAPLRALSSYWAMKKRARKLGEGGMHDFLRTLQSETDKNRVRIHLVGHSFGTIVASCMLVGPGGEGALSRPAESVVLVQGAVSLWSFAENIPYGSERKGYFNKILADRKISGPLLTTRSRFDRAVGMLYPLASCADRSVAFRPGELPRLGAIGAYGIQGLPADLVVARTMATATTPYAFEKGKIFNLEASQFICHGEGVSGAHSDIAGPEVAHAIWEAAFSSVSARG